MKFSTKDDIRAPIEFVFAELTDFYAFERSALRRGAEVQRVDELQISGPGMAWDVSFKLRGKTRELQMELTQLDRPNTLVVSSRSSTMGGHLVADLVALSRETTRMSIEIELQPKNLSARLLVQSLKLARGNLTKRFEQRVAEYGDAIEDRYRKTV